MIGADIDVAIVGGGIHGTILARAIQHFIPTLSQLTIDPAQEPLAVWNKRTQDSCMRTLRSPASHTIDYHFRSLLSFARKHNYPGSHFHMPYTRPSLTLFKHHSDSILSLMKQEWLSATLKGIQKNARQGFLLQSTAGDVSARYVILALGNGQPRIPSWATESWHVFHPKNTFPANTASLCIIGGGITAAHLCRKAISCNIATIYLLVRKALCTSQFDSNPCYIGPACGEEFFSLSDYQSRRELMNRVRFPGCIPPNLFSSLQAEINAGRIQLLEDNVVRVENSKDNSNEDAPPRYQIITERTSIQVESIMLATGLHPLPDLSLLEECIPAMGLKRSVNAYPIPDESLAWTPGLFLTGALAELEVGPAAQNIIGAHLSARRIVPALQRVLG